MSDLAGKQIGNYHLIHLLGRGSVAEVYLGEPTKIAWHPPLVAVKVFNYHPVEHFGEIIDIGAFFAETKVYSLQHPGITKIFGSSTDTQGLSPDVNYPHIAMQYMSKFLTSIFEHDVIPSSKSFEDSCQLPHVEDAKRAYSFALERGTVVNTTATARNMSFAAPF